MRTLKIKLRVLVTGGQFRFGVVGQSHSNVFWTNSRMTSIMVCYSNGPVNHILVYPRDYVDPLTLTLGLIMWLSLANGTLANVMQAEVLKSVHTLEFVLSYCLLGVLLAPNEKKPLPVSLRVRDQMAWKKSRLASLRVRDQMEREVQLF